MNAEVVCVSSREPTEPYYHYRAFRESLRRFGITPVVLGTDSPWRGLMTKPYLLREWLRAGRNTSDRIIVSDAWDVVFSGHPHGIGDRCAELFGESVVFNCEKGCWPRADLADRFPETTSPWKYLNSGFMCGPAAQILKLLEYMDIERIGFDPIGGPYPNDQGEFQRCFVEQPVPMALDTGCMVSQTLSACTLEEFDLSGEQVRNVVMGTYPGVWHFNGDAKNKAMPTFFEKWNLS